MFRGLFNRLYVGKNKKDLEPEDMATSPVQTFFEVLGVRAFDLVKLSLLFSLFCIPTFWWSIRSVQALTYAADIFATTEVVLIYFFGMVPCTMISSIGLTGLAAVTSRFARDQHAWVLPDFWAAIKENWKRGLLFGAIFGAVLALGVYVIAMYAFTAAQEGSAMVLIFQYVFIIFLALFMMVNIYLWPMMVIYDMRVGQLLKYSISLTLIRLPYTLLFAVLALLPWAIPIWLLLSYEAEIAVYIFLVIYIVFGFGFTQYMLCACAWAAFKRHIQSPEDVATLREEGEEPAPKKKQRDADEDIKGVWNFLDEKDDGEAENKDDKNK